MPRADRAERMPAHESHANEKVTVGIQPYVGRLADDTFSVKYSEHDYLPVFVAITNDSADPVELANMNVQLITANRTKLFPATPDDLFRRLSRTERRGDESNRTKLPVPLPRGKPKVGVSKDAREEIDAAQFHARAVEAQSTRGGFLFFDIRGVREPLRGARLYLTGLRDSRGQDLMFFEIPLDGFVAQQ